MFYVALGGTNNGYLCYRSSTDGSTWGSENVASHAAISSSDFDVFTDGSTIYVAYPVGTYNTDNLTSTTGYVRTGTQSSGTIMWNTPVQIMQAGAGWAWDLTQTTSRIYLALRAYADGYRFIIVLIAALLGLKVSTTKLGIKVGRAVSRFQVGIFSIVMAWS